jgi:distribution and morphology protein 34
MTGSRGMLAAKQPLVVPMLLRLSHFKLNSYVVLVVSKQKGITLVFKTDPLQHVDINSTFDSIAVIQKFIQREIEGQLRQMFREDLPGIIHRLSQQWVKAKVEAPYLSKRTVPQVPRPFSLHEPASPAFSSPLSLQSAPAYSVAAPSVFGLRRPRSVSGLSTSSYCSTPKPLPTPATGLESPTSFPEIENFDPTYGLRPEGLPTKSLFNNFSKLFSPAKGLAELTESLEDVDELDELASFSDGVSNTRPPTPSIPSENPQDYETIPAVGGGTITRPRVYFSQSQVQSPAGATSVDPVLQAPSYLRRSASLEYEALPRIRGSSPLQHPTLPSPLVNSHFGTFDPSHTRTSSATQPPPSRYSNPEPHSLPPTSTTHPVTRRANIHAPLPTPPPSEPYTDPGNSASHRRRRSEDRRSSMSSSIPDRFDTTSSSLHGSFGPDPDPQIILRPSLNEHVFKLSTLTHSNHTLSPFTRSLEHFAVRSGPPKAPVNSGVGDGPADRLPQAKVKAKRKRIYCVGGKKKEPEEPPQPKFPPAPASDFDESDMDRYFKWRDEVDQHQQVDPNHQPSLEELSSTQFTSQPHPAQLRKRYLRQSLSP